MKFSGIVGFVLDEVDVSLGTYKPQVEERQYKGDVRRNTRRNVSTDYQNSDVEISNQISILSDLYSQQNWNSIKYVIWNGVKWSVTNIDLSDYPRLILDLGGVYNGNPITTT